MSSNRSLFKQQVIEIVRMIPYGRVVSYSQVATYVGLPRSARQVGWILNEVGGKIAMPWWRVVNNKGYLSIRGNQSSDKELQRKLLLAEGVVVNERFELDMQRYRFVADRKALLGLNLSEAYLDHVMEKYV